jgi:hypothetical protein
MKAIQMTEQGAPGVLRLADLPLSVAAETYRPPETGATTGKLVLKP